MLGLHAQHAALLRDAAALRARGRALNLLRRLILAPRLSPSLHVGMFTDARRGCCALTRSFKLLCVCVHAYVCVRVEEVRARGREEGSRGGGEEERVLMEFCWRSSL